MDVDMSSFGSDELFYGSKRVHLASVPGQACRFVAEDWEVDMSDEALRSTLARNSPLRQESGCSTSVADVIVPCIPARELARKPTSEAAARASDLSMWPVALQKPLLKMREASCNEPKAVASGCRSALVKLEGEWYRLKGCGNNDEGFTIRTTPAAPGQDLQATRDIRGSAFAQTAFREDYVTAKLTAALEPKGILGCNIAVGTYHYDAPNCPLGIANEELRPACIVEKTRGDRRLGTHVLAGIELLLPLLVDEAGITESTLLSYFPQGRPQSNSLAELPMTADLMYDNMVCEMAATPELAKEFSPYGGIQYNENSLCCLAVGGQALPERSPQTSSSTGFPQQWTRDGPRDMSLDWHGLWLQTCTELSAALSSIEQCSEKKPCGVLGYLFSRIGLECGRFISELHALNISWGTYQDAMCRRDYDEWHCNAHANNMVMLSESIGLEAKSFLSYLDLDMAFSQTDFVDTWAPEGTPTNERLIGEDAWKMLLHREDLNFMEVLAGGDVSNGVPMVAKPVVDGYSPILKGVKAALYDTLVLGYMHGRDKDSRTPVAEFDLELHQVAYAVIKLAIIVMADFVA